MLEKRLPFRFPGGKRCGPGRGLVEGANVYEGLVEGEEFLIRRQGRVSGQMGVAALADMEEATLNAGRGPELLHDRLEWSVAIDDRGFRCRGVLEESSPGRALLCVGVLPVDDMPAGKGDEDAPAVEIGAVEHDLVVDFPRGRQGGSDVPTPADAVAERAPGDGVSTLCLGASQPVLEGIKFGFAGDVGARLRSGGPAVFASPSGTSGARLSVLHELAGAYTTSGLIPRKRH